MPELAMFYDVPSVSVKGCCYHLMRSNASGFRVDRPANSLPEGTSKEVQRKYFFWDSEFGHAVGWMGWGCGEEGCKSAGHAGGRAAAIPWRFMAHGCTHHTVHITAASLPPCCHHRPHATPHPCLGAAS